MIQSLPGRERRIWLLALTVLCLLALAIAIAPSARLGSWSTIRFSHFLVIPAWVMVAWLAQRFVGRILVRRDPLLLPTAFLLIGVGLLTVWRISSFWGARQTAWFLVGSVLLIEVIRAPRDLNWLFRYRYVWLSAGLLLTGLTLILGTNPAGGEARLWLGCCGIYFQPSEALRILLIVYMASYLADRLVFGRSQLLARPAASLAPIALAWGLSAALLIFQRDLGAGMLLLGSLALMLFAATGHIAVFLGSAAIGIFGGLVGYQMIDLIQVRVQTWLNPFADPIGSGYQVIQSMIAFASGGILGSGPGMGSPGRVPVAHSDFIFAAIGEEWGLLGSLGIIALIWIVVSRGIRASATARTPFRALLAAGISFALALQSILIIGGVTRFLPLTGVTLPFVSYGGTSLVTSMLGLALLLVISADNSQKPWIDVQRIQSLFTFAWVALAISIGWWSLIQAPELVSRSDNPRRAIESQFSPRGRILDRNGDVLADTLGIEGEYQRTYPLGSDASVTGYDSPQFGQAGLELSMDAYLRGDAGNDPLEVAWTRLLRSSPPPGVDVVLTLDVEIQRKAAQALRGKHGGIIVMDASTGEILALSSNPTFDPNQLSTDWDDLTQSQDAPFILRPIQGRYQPGMALAPFLYAWAEELQIELKSEPFIAPDLEGYTWTCDGTISGLAAALQSHCPIAFAALGEEIGKGRLEQLFSILALDRPPQIRLESPLDVQPIQLGEEVSLEAVGQGELTLSPITLARSFALLAYPLDQPGLRLVTTAGSKQLAVLGSGIQPTGPAMREAAMDALGTRAGKWIQFAAEAYLGVDTKGLAWYLAASIEGKVVVIVLEESTREMASEIGVVFLDLLTVER
jgi:cell division protein FtsW (lipid II flippase)